MKKILFFTCFTFITISPSICNNEYNAILQKTCRISLNVSPILSGSVSGGGSYLQGTSVTVSATPNKGYAFSHWSERNRKVSEDASYTFVATNSRSLVANFNRVKTFVITLTVSPFNSGKVSGSGLYEQGSTATITAEPNSGYSFLHWKEGEAIVSTFPSYSFIVNSNRNLVGIFSKDRNKAPIASDLSITGDLYVCKTIAGHYTYSDSESDPEKGSVFRWYRASSPKLNDTVFIQGATNINYTLTDEDHGKYIYFSVTPKASSGTITGETKLSIPTGVISKSIPGVTFSSSQNSICKGQSIVINIAFTGTPPFNLLYTDGKTEYNITSASDNYTLTVNREGTYKGISVKDYYSCTITDLPSTIKITVNPLPVIDFAIDKFCLNGDSIAFINHTQSENISSWEWHFGDSAATSDKNISYKFEPKHLYQREGDYKVTLIAKNTNSCSDSIQKTIQLKASFKVDFSWKSECFIKGNAIRFNSITSNNNDNLSYKWILQNNPGTIIQYNSKDIQHVYPQLNVYPVKLVISSANGCKDSISKTISLRPVIALKDTSYFNSFEINQGYWYSDNSVNKWIWGTPKGNTINTAYSGNKALFTSFEKPRKNEQLIVISPCFDFSGVTRPYIQLWVNANTASGKEGAVLQYTVDSLQQWTNVGLEGYGVNWFNDNVISASPGGQKSGWSGTSGWLQVRNNLDVLSGKKYVRFRIAYGSNTTSLNSDGFAIDDIYIGKRTNMVLMEHFTDISNINAMQSNIEVDKVLKSAPNDVLGIQYHKSFSGTDTFSTSYSSARILYYGIGNIPQCYLDGGTIPSNIYDFSAQKPNLKDVYSRTLKASDYRITFDKEKSSQQIAGFITVRALRDLAYREIYIYIAVVEDISVQSGTSVITYQNVLKTLLPVTLSNYGYYKNGSWQKDNEIYIPYNWPLKNVYNIKNLKLIAFIQDNRTREIYQAAGVNAEMTVGIQTVKETNRYLNIFPNPASDIATLRFDKVVPTGGYDLKVFDNTGKILKQCRLLQGISEFKLSVADLPQGIYFIKISNINKGISKSLKLIIGAR